MKRGRAKKGSSGDSKLKKVSQDDTIIGRTGNEENLTDEEAEQNDETVDEQPTIHLQRKGTVTIEEESTEEIKLTKRESLKRRRSSLNEQIQIEDDIINELSDEVKTKLEKRLSSILQPIHSRNEVIIHSTKVQDDESIELEMNLQASESVDESPMDDLPSELIVQIFDSLEDDDRWSLACVCKRFFSIFKLYVGWRYMPVLSDRFKSVPGLCNHNANFEVIKTDLTYLVVGKMLFSYSSRQYQLQRDRFNKNEFVLPDEKYSYFFVPPKKGRYIYPGSETRNVLLIFHPTQKRREDWKNEFFENMTVFRDTPLPDTELLGIVPLGLYAIKSPPPIYFNKSYPFKQILLGDAKFTYKDCNDPNAVNIYNNYYYGNPHLFSGTSGVDRSSLFCKVQSTIDINHNVIVQIMFNLKEFARAYQRHGEISDDVKVILLRLLQSQSLRSSKTIKWSYASRELMNVRPTSQPENMKLKLFDYQLRGLAWMLDIERNILKRKYTFSRVCRAPGYPTVEFDMFAGPFSSEPKLSEFRIINDDDLQQSTDLYHTFTTRGAVMADEMGLGKTITMISLIMANPRKLDESGGLRVEDRAKAKIEAKTTLIICPNQLLTQWEKEISLASGSTLKTITLMTIKDLKSHSYFSLTNADIVLISHQFLKNANYLKVCGKFSTLQERSQKSSHTINSKATPVLQFIGWHRIIIDEGHEFLSTQTSADGKDLFRSFLSNYRWYVTGTPVPRGRDSIVGLLNFLECSIDLDENSSLLTAAYETCLFAAAKQNLFWKNTKKAVSNQAVIPGVVEDIKFLNLSPTEQAIYDAAESINDVESMRLACSQPLDAPLVRNIGEINRIAEIGPKMIARLREKLQHLRKKLPTYKTNLPKYIEDETKNRQTLEQLQRQKPAEQIVRAGLLIENPEHRNWRLECSRLTKLVSDLIEKGQKTRTKIIESENEIYSLVSQAACFSRILIGTSDSECQLCCSLAVEPEVTKCGHYFCSVCILKFIRKNSHCPVCNSALLISDLHPPSKSSIKIQPANQKNNNNSAVRGNDDDDDDDEDGDKKMSDTKKRNKNKKKKEKEKEAEEEEEEEEEAPPVDMSKGLGRLPPKRRRGRRSALTTRRKATTTTKKRTTKKKKVESSSSDDNESDDDKKMKDNNNNNNNNNDDDEDKRKKKVSKSTNEELKLINEIREKYGTKISAILQEIMSILATSSRNKVIVFSKWDNMLNTLASLLDSHYKFPVVDDKNDDNNTINGNEEDDDDGDTSASVSSEGSMSEAEKKKIRDLNKRNKSIHVACKGNVTIRNRIIKQFNSDDAFAPRVMFLSLSNTASGTHLTVASHIILVDPPSGTKEEAIACDSQAIARSHRIGQDQQVKVFRFLVENSIDHDDYNRAYGN